ncbi:MAG: BrnA antitoxin family protein [Acidiferrobacterales bacterium]
MRAEYDFSKGKRGALVPPKGKTRITIYIDDSVLNEFRARAERVGAGYQTMMNEALKAFLKKNEKPVTAAILRQIIREELPQASRPARRLTGRVKAARR